MPFIIKKLSSFIAMYLSVEMFSQNCNLNNEDGVVQLSYILYRWNILPLTKQSLEWFSFECQKVTGFALSTLHDWLKKFTPLFHPIRSTTKTNRDVFACIFPRFESATCNYFEFWLVHCIVCVLCDWLG